MAHNKYYLSAKDINILKKLLREPRPIASSMPGPRRTRRNSGGGEEETSSYTVGLATASIPGAFTNTTSAISGSAVAVISPSSFQAHLVEEFYGGAPVSFSRTPVEVWNAYGSTIPVTSGKAVVCHFVNNFLINIDCTEIANPF